MPGSDFHFDASPRNEFSPSADAVRSQCHSLVIVDDEILENTEHLEVVLTLPVGAARLLEGVTVMRVAISDDDTVMVGFTQTMHTVDEDASVGERTLDACVHMTGDIEREVSVLVTSQLGSAHRKN